MSGQERIQSMLALRHAFQVNNRLQLEFLAMLSKLLRDHGVWVSDELLRAIILAVPDELTGGSFTDDSGVGKAHQLPTPGPQPPTAGGWGPKDPAGGWGPKEPGGGPGPGPQPQAGASGGPGPQPPQGGGPGPQPPQGGGPGPQPPTGGGPGPQPPAGGGPGPQKPPGGGPGPQPPKRAGRSRKV